jgi:N12 class adenine-specific DNA methylase
MVAELESALEDAKAEGRRTHKRSKIEKQIEQMKRRIEGKHGEAKDQTLTFEDMGVDFLYVDEAHEFRKLDFATNRQAKGIDQGARPGARPLHQVALAGEASPGPQSRARLRNAGHEHHGRAVTRSCATWTRRRWRRTASAFDAWANMFGEVAPATSRTPPAAMRSSSGLQVRKRPRADEARPQFMDVLTSSDPRRPGQAPEGRGRRPRRTVVTPPRA